MCERNPCFSTRTLRPILFVRHMSPSFQPSSSSTLQGEEECKINVPCSESLPRLCYLFSCRVDLPERPRPSSLPPGQVPLPLYRESWTSQAGECWVSLAEILVWPLLRTTSYQQSIRTVNGRLLTCHGVLLTLNVFRKHRYGVGTCGADGLVAQPRVTL